MNKGTFYIRTLGCKVNQYESQVMREGFLRNGYIEAGCIDEADICIVNTCTVTSASDSKSLRLIRNAVKKDKCVIATGCMVEDKELDLRHLNRVNFIIKNKDKYKIPQIIDSDTIHDSPFTIHGISGFKGHTRVFVKIQDGCSNVCSYCKVRIVRGRSKSRPFDEVVDECTKLIRNGSKEIVLTGICLGAYGRDLGNGLNLLCLIKEICKIDGNWRLRLSSIEPKDIGDDLINFIRSEKKLCKHLHIPFQSGDDYILKRMHRPYTRKDYLNIVNRLKKAIPDIAISTDIMVGFPGETDKRFHNTIDFLTMVRPMRTHVFPFSKRKGTSAYNYKSNIPGFVKEEREKKLLRLAGDLAREFVGRFIDREVEVLVEDKRADCVYLQGYTERYIKLFIDGLDSLKGQLVNCRLTLTDEKPYGILIPRYNSFPF